MIRHYLLITVLMVQFATAQTSLPHTFSYAIAYRTNIMRPTNGERSAFLYRRINGYMTRDVRLPGDTLRGSRLDSIWVLLTDTINYRRGATMACFTPHHALVFCDAQDSIMLQIDICLECNYLEATDWRESYSQLLGDYRLSSIPGGPPTTGFSRRGFAKWKTLFCDQLEMGACPEGYPLDHGNPPPPNEE